MTARERTFYRDLGGWMMSRRRLLAVTQTEFAEEFGTTASTLRKWEKGAIRVPAYVVHRTKEMLAAKGLKR
jgi:DNA-binding transcriptional regulator YiaG